MVSKRDYFMIAVSCLVFFILTSYWSLQWPSPHYNSPDETATAVFISQFVNTGSFRMEEPLNMGLGIIHPRSTTTIGTATVPGGFLGLPFLYGTIARVVGLWAIPFLTPFFASLAAFAFFYALVSWASVRIATWSTVALLAHPAWIYYTARGLFPDVLSVAFVLFAVAAFRMWMTRQRDRHRWSLLFLVGMFLSSAIAVRATAVLWVIPLAAMSLWMFRRDVSRWDVMTIGGGAALPLFALAGLHTMTYGSAFATGYTPFGSIKESVDIGARVAPDGLVVWRIAQNILDYLVSMFWWYTIPIVLGVAIAVRCRKSILYWIPACAGMTIASGILILYYGSWDIRDSAVHGPTIGTSFVRYWLPITIASLPFFGLAISRWIRSWPLRAITVVALIASSAVPIFLPIEGLSTTRDITHETAAVGASLIQRTEPNAIIVTEQADKILFPERRVVINDPADREKIERSLPTLLAYAPVYYISVLAGIDIVYINDRLEEYGVAWSQPELFGDYWLYTLRTI